MPWLNNYKAQNGSFPIVYDKFLLSMGKQARVFPHIEAEGCFFLWCNGMPFTLKWTNEYLIFLKLHDVLYYLGWE